MCTVLGNPGQVVLVLACLDIFKQADFELTNQLIKGKKDITYQQKRNRETDKSISGHSPGLKSWRTLGLLESDHRRYCALAALPTSFVGLKRHLKLEFWPLRFSSGD